MKNHKLLTLSATISLLMAPVLPTPSWMPELGGQVFASTNAIDTDSDNDGIQNRADLDDDNDGIPDDKDKDDQ